MPWGFLWVVFWVLFQFPGFVFGAFCWVFDRVFSGSPVYISYVRRGILRFHFYKILLIKKEARE